MDTQRSRGNKARDPLAIVVALSLFLVLVLLVLPRVIPMGFRIPLTNSGVVIYYLDANGRAYFTNSIPRPGFSSRETMESSFSLRRARSLRIRDWVVEFYSY